ncbi:hypothetical protein XH92_35225 [Bradyrhizobium sp. CCBAU 53421]|nr:hypothetical protein XH92_35225 [Bradyrhizobium sp. CCBAU 53421]
MAALRPCSPAASALVYRRHYFLLEMIGYSVWLYFRFPLSLRVLDECRRRWALSELWILRR